MTVEGARLDGDGSAIVDSVVERKGAGRIGLKWQLRRGENGWRVIDLVVEGVSMAVTQRSEFVAVIRGQGGIEGLLAALRKRTAQL